MLAKSSLSLSFLLSHLVGDTRNLAMQLSEFKESSTFEEVWQDQQIDLLEPREYLGEVFAGKSRQLSSAEMDSQITSLRANFAQVTPQALIELAKYLDVQLVKLTMEISTNYLPAIQFMADQTVDFFLLVASFYQRHKAVHCKNWRNNPDSFFYLSVSKCLNEKGYDQVDSFLACSEMYHDCMKQLVKEMRGEIFSSFEAYASQTVQRFSEEQRQLERFRAALAALTEDLLEHGFRDDQRKTGMVDKIEETYGRVVVSTLFIVNETSTTLRSSFNVIEHTMNTMITALQEVKIFSDDFDCNFYDADKEDPVEDPRPLQDQVLEFQNMPAEVLQDILIEDPEPVPPYDPLIDFKASPAKLRTLGSIYETLSDWLVCVCPFLDFLSDELRPDRAAMPRGILQAIEGVPQALRDQLNPTFLIPNASSASFLFEARISKGHFPQTGVLVLAQDYLAVSCKSFTSETTILLPFSLVADVNEVTSFFGSKNGLEIFMKGSSESLKVFVADEDRKEILKAGIGFGIKRSSRIYDSFENRVDAGDLVIKVEELWQMHVRRARCWIMFSSLLPILPEDKRATETVENCRLTDLLEVCIGCSAEFNEAWCLDDWRKKHGALQIEYPSPFFIPDCYFNTPGTSPVQAILEAPLHHTFIAKYKRKLEDGSEVDVVEGNTIFNYSRDEVLVLFEYCSKPKTERSCFILKQSEEQACLVLASHEEEAQIYGRSWLTRVKDKCIRNARSKLRKVKRQATAADQSTQQDQPAETASLPQTEPKEKETEPQTSPPDPNGPEKNPSSSQSSEKDLSSFEKVDADPEETSPNETN